MEGLLTFLDGYEKEIAPRLMELDVLMRAEGGAVPRSEICRILDVSPGELAAITEKLGIDSISAKHLPRLMAAGGSAICGLFRREVTLGSPYTYDAAAVSYVYGLPIDRVARAFDNLGLAEATSLTLPLVFSKLKAEEWKG
jgi:hypothetical protein